MLLTRHWLLVLHCQRFSKTHQLRGYQLTFLARTARTLFHQKQTEDTQNKKFFFNSVFHVVYPFDTRCRDMN